MRFNIYYKCVSTYKPTIETPIYYDSESSFLYPTKFKNLTIKQLVSATKKERLESNVFKSFNEWNTRLNLEPVSRDKFSLKKFQELKIQPDYFVQFSWYVAKKESTRDAGLGCFVYFSPLIYSCSYYILVIAKTSDNEIYDVTSLIDENLRKEAEDLFLPEKRNITGPAYSDIKIDPLADTSL